MSAARPPWKRVLALLLRGITYAGAAFICFEISVWIHPPLMAWGLAMVDRRFECGAGEALAGARQHARTVNRSREMVVSSKRIATDDAAKLDLWHTPRGDWWIPQGSEDNVLGFLSQQQERIYGDGEWAVQKGDIVLDAGANVGMYVRQALDEGAALVIAIEPGPENVEAMRRSLMAEIEAGRVIVVPVGVWDKEEALPLYADPHNSGADSFVIRAPNDVVVASVPLIRIDKLVADLHLPRVDFIKMDIKGATVKALEGARQTIQTYKPRLALSTEELEDRASEVHAAVLSLQPDYRMRCGMCSVGSHYNVNPDVLLFRDPH